MCYECEYYCCCINTTTITDYYLWLLGARTTQTKIPNIAYHEYE